MILFENEDYRDAAALSFYLTSSLIRDNPHITLVRQPPGTLLGGQPWFSQWWDLDEKIWLSSADRQFPQGNLYFRRVSRDSLNRYQTLDLAKAWVQDTFPKEDCCWVSYYGGFEVFPDTKNSELFVLEMAGAIRA